MLELVFPPPWISALIYKRHRLSIHTLLGSLCLALAIYAAFDIETEDYDRL